MINVENNKEVSLIIGSPNFESLRFALFKFKTCSLYNIQNPYSKNNFIDVVREYKNFYHTDLNNLNIQHYKKFNKQKIINDLKKDTNNVIVIYSVMPRKLKHFGSKLIRLASDYNKQIIVCLFVREVTQERLNYEITLPYLQKLNIGLNDYRNVYWVFNEYCHSSDYDLDFCKTWVKNLRSDEVEYL